MWGEMLQQEAVEFDSYFFLVVSFIFFEVSIDILLVSIDILLVSADIFVVSVLDLVVSVVDPPELLLLQAVMKPPMARITNNFFIVLVLV